MDLYAEEILEHFKHPLNKGKIKKPTHSAKGDNPLCGDELEVFLLTEKGVVVDAKFSGQGCAISQAAADILLDYVKGKNIFELEDLDEKKVLDLLGVDVGPARIKCALLALNTLRKAVH